MALLLLVGVLVALAVWEGWFLADWATLGYAVAVGLANRIPTTPFVGSDVMAVTREALDVLSAGGNPYTHVYIHTNPYNSPFPYLPGELAFYAIPRAISGDVAGADKWAGVGVVLLLASLALCVSPSAAALGTALYATFGAAAFHALDGSNDTSLAFLTVLAIVLLAWSERGGRGARVAFYASAVVFAWALLFKEFVWLLYPFVLVYLRGRGSSWRGHGLVTLGLTGLVLLPFILWSPEGFVRNVVAGVTFHHDVAGLTIWMAIQPYAPHLVTRIMPFIPAFSLVVVGGAGIVMLRRPAGSLGLALFRGLLLVVLSFWLARRSATSYYVFAVAIFAATVALAAVHRDPM